MSPNFERALALRSSSNKTERQSLFLGSLLADGSPLLVHINSIVNHLYIRGAPGSGKSAMLAFICELLLSRGSCLMHVFDLKKNGTRALLAALQAGAARSGMRVLWFVDAEGRATHTFNIFIQSFFQTFAPMDKADFIAGALGSSHGLEGYGKQHFGSIAVRILLEVFRRWSVCSWIELEVRINTVLSHARACGLDKTMVQGATQLRNDVNRLAQIPALNHSTSSIDLCSKEPLAVYWSFPNKFAMAGAISRMAVNGSFAASDVNSEIRRWLVIDEFQRVVGNSTEQLFTQSRDSLGLLLANQSLADLRTRDRDYGPLVQTCCRIHWTFNVSDPEEQKFMAETSGKVTRKQKTTSYRIGPFGLVSGETRSYTEVEADRHGLNDVKLTSATPGLSIFCCKQDEGFIQHGGQDQIIRTEFHTNKREHAEREALPWPGPEDGTITGELPPLLGPPSAPGPKPVTPANIVNPAQAKPPRRAPKNPMP